MLTLISGGIKSGKSVFAEKLAFDQQQQVYYIATATITDDDMEKRVEIHRNRRPSHWKNIEEKHDLFKVFDLISEVSAVALIDCLTTFLTNRLWTDQPELFEDNSSGGVKTEIIDEMQSIAQKFSVSKHHFIVVSNEVGLGLIPPTRIGRIFCDLQGKVNQIFAQQAQHVYFTVSGIPMKIK